MNLFSICCQAHPPFKCVAGLSYRQLYTLFWRAIFIMLQERLLCSLLWPLVHPYCLLTIPLAANPCFYCAASLGDVILRLFQLLPLWYCLKLPAFRQERVHGVPANSIKRALNTLRVRPWWCLASTCPLGRGQVA